jgi:hypothetical protein
LGASTCGPWRLDEKPELAADDVSICHIAVSSRAKWGPDSIANSPVVVINETQE